MAFYTVKSKVDKTKEKEEVFYYAVAHSARLKSIDELAEEISATCSLTPGDVLATVSALSDCIERHLAAGNSVKLPGIGVFSLSANSEGFRTSKECTPSKVSAKRICFKADMKLRNVLKFIKFTKKQ